jgi:hypothetical protein
LPRRAVKSGEDVEFRTIAAGKPCNIFIVTRFFIFWWSASTALVQSYTALFFVTLIGLCSPPCRVGEHAGVDVGAIPAQSGMRIRRISAVCRNPDIIFGVIRVFLRPMCSFEIGRLRI